MNHSKQTVLIAAQSKLGNSVSPVPRHIFGYITDETKANGKAFAMREFIKNQSALVAFIKPATFDDKIEAIGVSNSRKRPSWPESFAVCESVVVNPASLDHPVKDSREQALHLVVREHKSLESLPSSN